MGDIIQFKQKPTPTELEKAADDIIDRLEYLVDGLDHINLSAGILLVGRDKSSVDIRLNNQTKEIKKTSYEPGANEKLNEAIKRKDK